MERRERLRDHNKGGEHGLLRASVETFLKRKGHSSHTRATTTKQQNSKPCSSLLGWDCRMKRFVSSGSM